MADLAKLNVCDNLMSFKGGTVSHAIAADSTINDVVPGEHTTGWTSQGASKSDKKTGVTITFLSCHDPSQVAGLTLFDLRRLGKVGMVGVNGSKFPLTRQHLRENISDVHKDMDAS